MILSKVVWYITIYTDCQKLISLLDKTTISWKHVCLFFYSVYTILQVIFSQQWSGVLPELCFYVSKYKLYLHIQQLPKLYHIHSQLLFYKFLLYLQWIHVLYVHVHNIPIKDINISFYGEVLKIILSILDFLNTGNDLTNYPFWPYRYSFIHKR